MYRRGYHEDHGSIYKDDHDDHHDDHMKDEEQAMKAMGNAKSDYWGGYYDFLINEGSYKFWAVFQVSFDQFLLDCYTLAGLRYYTTHDSSHLLRNLERFKGKLYDNIGTRNRIKDISFFRYFTRSNRISTEYGNS